MQKQQEKIAESIAKADIVITTAQIPGKKAPILITEEMMNAMRNGSVIIDLAAATGGNTPFTKNNETVVIMVLPLLVIVTCRPPCPVMPANYMEKMC